MDPPTSETDTAAPISECSVIRGAAAAQGGIEQQSPAGKLGLLFGFSAWSEGLCFSWVVDYFIRNIFLT